MLAAAALFSYPANPAQSGQGSRIIGLGIRIKLGIWRVNLGDRHLASSLVAGDPGELGELTLFATLTQTQTRAFGEFGLKLYTDTDTQQKCSRCSCKFKRNVFILIKVVCYILLPQQLYLNVIERKYKRQIFMPDPIILEKKV